jgi:hypothetical protein
VHAGIVAQGLLQYLACAHEALVWKSFGSWFRTLRPGIPPSERVCSRSAISFQNISWLPAKPRASQNSSPRGQIHIGPRDYAWLRRERSRELGTLENSALLRIQVVWFFATRS